MWILLLLLLLKFSDGIQLEMVTDMISAPGVVFKPLGYCNQELNFEMIAFQAFIGFDGLIYDLQQHRVFIQHPIFEESIRRPERYIHQLSEDKPRIGQSGLVEIEAPVGKGENHKRLFALQQKSSHAYYHFVAENLYKLLLIQDSLNAFPNTKIVVDTRFGNTWSVPYLELLGFNQSQILERSSGEMIYGEAVHFTSGTNLHKPCPHHIQTVANKLLAAAAETTTPKEDVILVVSRTAKNNQHTAMHPSGCEGKGCKVRIMTNEHELVDRLKAAYPSSKVVLFDSSRFSIKEQIRLFSSAKVIIGAHGAGLTNLIFAQPKKTLVIELIPQHIPKYVAEIFSYLAECMDIIHRPILITADMMTRNSQNSLDNFECPIDTVIKTIQSIDK